MDPGESGSSVLLVYLAKGLLGKARSEGNAIPKEFVAARNGVELKR